MKNSSNTYLVEKTHLKQKALTVRIPLHVHVAVNALREQADAAGFVFDVQAVVVEALERAVFKVESDLSSGELKSSQRDVRQPRRRVKVMQPVASEGE